MGTLAARDAAGGDSRRSSRARRDARFPRVIPVKRKDSYETIYKRHPKIFPLLSRLRALPAALGGGELVPQLAVVGAGAVLLHADLHVHVRVRVRGEGAVLPGVHLHRHLHVGLL